MKKHPHQCFWNWQAWPDSTQRTVIIWCLNLQSVFSRNLPVKEKGSLLPTNSKKIPKISKKYVDQSDFICIYIYMCIFISPPQPPVHHDQFPTSWPSHWLWHPEVSLHRNASMGNDWSLDACDTSMFWSSTSWRVDLKKAKQSDFNSQP